MRYPLLVAVLLFAGCGGSSRVELASGQSAFCPAAFPTNGAFCVAAVTCDYVNWGAYHPPGDCTAICGPGDGGGLVWTAPSCQ